MAARAKTADASFFYASPLFLKPCSKEIYLAFIRQHFPNLEQMYQERFASEAFASRAYQKRIEALVKAVRTKHGLGRRADDVGLFRQPGGSADERAGRLAFDLDFGPR